MKWKKFNFYFFFKKDFEIIQKFDKEKNGR